MLHTLRASASIPGQRGQRGRLNVCGSHKVNASVHETPTKASRRQGLLALLSLATCALSPPSAIAAEVEQTSSIVYGSKAPADSVYFGNGCFWGRQYDFVKEELSMGRSPEQVSAVVGYAGGPKAGPGNKVCYYYSDPRTVYEKLGHAEVVQLNLSADGSVAQDEFKRFSEVYLKQFRKTPFGMQRLDPQDEGPGYRNVIGLPGGVKSPLFKILQDANQNRMELREGKGNLYENGKPTEGDLFNVVWVVDSNQLPFYRAERYHQFHNGIGKAFPKNYTQDLKNTLTSLGRLDSTGCPELPF